MPAAGIDVPDRIAIAGFGDFEVARCCHPRLTTIAVDCAAIGRKAAETALAAIEARNRNESRNRKRRGRIPRRGPRDRLKAQNAICTFIDRDRSPASSKASRAFSMRGSRGDQRLYVDQPLAHEFEGERELLVEAERAAQLELLGGDQIDRESSCRRRGRAA